MPINKIKPGAEFLDYPLYLLPKVDITSLKVHGEGRKKVMVIINEDDCKNKLEFIQRVLSPLGIQEQDAFIILLTSDQNVSFAELCRNFDFNHLILFGMKVGEIGLQIQTKLYVPLKITEKEILFVDGVAVFLDEKEKGGGRPKARQLWSTLKSFLD